VRTIMTGMGMALMGTGVAKGENRALEAAQRAISSPLLEETSIQGAKGVLINISGGYDLTLYEVAEAAQIIAEAVDPDANIISGMVIDETLEEAMKVTVIATGFDEVASGERPAPHPDLVRSRERQPISQRAQEEEPARFHREERDEEPRSEPERFERPAAAAEERHDEEPEVPFYRKVLAHRQTEDSGGFGPNWSNVDDYDIPTVLRKQMD